MYKIILKLLYYNISLLLTLAKVQGIGTPKWGIYSSFNNEYVTDITRHFCQL